MDVAYYLSELLGELGEVNVPGLGYFVLLRFDGHYNDEEATFYPPGHTVHFDHQFIDDDVLAQYVADKKHISLASSKYFTKKYIDNLLQDVGVNDVALADLGWLSADQSRIVFKPADVHPNDPAFFGYPQIRINKLDSSSILNELQSQYVPNTVILPPPTNIQPAPFTPERPPAPASEPVVKEAVAVAVAPTPAFSPAPQQDVQEDEEDDFIFRGKTYVDEDEKNSWLRKALIVFAVLIIIGVVSVLAVYKLKPSVFDRFRHVQPVPIILKKIDTAKKPLSTDTAKKVPGVVKDTTAKSAPVSPAQGATIDSTKTRYEVVGTSAATLTEANNIIKNYKNIGLEGHIITDAPGRRRKISIGTYTTDTAATNALAKFLRSGKVQRDIYILKINPKQ